VDCGTERGSEIVIGEKVDGVLRAVDNLDTSAATRVLARDVEVD
jgi:hypothetical protein